MTFSEDRVERLLGENDISFEREYPCPPYRLDFFVPTFLVCIEVDGPYHRLRRHSDHRRDIKLWERGIRTVRVDSGWDLTLTWSHIQQEFAAAADSLGERQLRYEAWQ